MLKRIKIGDLVIVIVVLILGFIPVLTAKNNKPDQYSIIINGVEIMQIPADVDTTVTISAPLGKVIISVQDYRAKIVESNCPTKICIRTGYIDKVGESIVCVPNSLIIIAQGKSDGEKYDAILH